MSTARRRGDPGDPSRSRALMKALKFHEAHCGAYLCVRAVAPTVAQSKTMRGLWNRSRRELFAAIRLWAHTQNGGDRLGEARAIVTGRPQPKGTP